MAPLSASESWLGGWNVNSINPPGTMGRGIAGFPAVFGLSAVDIAKKVFHSLRLSLPSHLTRDNRFCQSFFSSVGCSGFKASKVPCLKNMGASKEAGNSILCPSSSPTTSWQLTFFLPFHLPVLFLLCYFQGFLVVRRRTWEE